ncbi:uncharacterized protein [Macaca nemestrina]|uniref:uncharacterized protein isoform X2 n=1 Tax=Macaca nemestrina TaxID=9545 RepID=UPI0039B955CB
MGERERHFEVFQVLVVSTLWALNREGTAMSCLVNSNGCPARPVAKDRLEGAPSLNIEHNPGHMHNMTGWASMGGYWFCWGCLLPARVSTHGSEQPCATPRDEDAMMSAPF